MKHNLAARVRNLEGQMRLNAVKRVGAVADIERIVAETADEDVRQAGECALDVNQIAAASQEERQFIGDMRPQGP